MDCIYIPLIERELIDLRFLSLTWRLFPPLRHRTAQTVDLIISFDKAVTPDIVRECKSLFTKFGFHQVRVISANLTDDEAIYTKQDQNHKGPVPELGLKNGPNKHWIFNQTFCSRNYNISLQSEVDLLPLKQFWFEDLTNNFNPDWLLSGALYQGPSQLDPKIANHINGNALYNTAHKNHQRWVALTQQCIKSLIASGDLSPAFDIAVHLFVNQKPKDDNHMSEGANGIDQLPFHDFVRDIFTSMHHTPLIGNFAGTKEAHDQHVIDFDHLIKTNFSKSILIHSQHFKFYLLGLLLERQQELSLADNKFIICYLRKLIPREKRDIYFKKYIASNQAIQQALNNSYIAPYFWGTKPKKEKYTMPTL